MNFKLDGKQSAFPTEQVCSFKYLKSMIFNEGDMSFGKEIKVRNPMAKERFVLINKRNI